MPSLPMDRNPKHSRHATGQGVVYLSGHAHYTGEWGSAESESKYRSLIIRWNANGRKALANPKDSSPTVENLAQRYLREVASRYVKRGKPTSAKVMCEFVLGQVEAMFGSLDAVEFSRNQFRELLRHYERSIGPGGKPLARSTLHGYMGVVRRWGLWAESEGLIPWQPWFLAQGCPLPPRVGRRTPDVAPAPADAVAAVLRLARPHVRGLIEFQLSTGARPAEACGVRPCDLDRSREPWVYRVAPEWNKTDHHDRERTVMLGPQARAVLLPLLEGCPPKRAIFANRRGVATTAAIYGDQVKRLCRRAGVAHWSPNMLRHNFATMVRRSDGLEAASACLGHSDVETTKIYAERDHDLAARTAERLG